ncbi:hypothetical protein [Agrobacterium tumefaciens]|uniref:hypothetical protein n=1 Tax=Agrobacterium tumefaciens TaxID=358 RepID=UPI003AF7BC4A
MRRKVVIGSLVLHHLDTSNDQDFKQRLGEWLSRELPGFLTCDNDKALFADLIGPGLPGTAETATACRVLHEPVATFSGRIQEHDASRRA